MLIGKVPVMSLWQMIRYGWRPKRILIACALGVALGMVLVARVEPPQAGIIAIAAIALTVLVLAFYVYSLIVLRYTERGREAMAEHVAKRQAKSKR